MQYPLCLVVELNSDTAMRRLPPVFSIYISNERIDHSRSAKAGLHRANRLHKEQHAGKNMMHEADEMDAG